jgi:hypothetical protein
MQSDNKPWSDIYREAGEFWADAEAAAQLLENCRSAVFAEWCVEQGDIPVNRAEQAVRAQPRWQEYNKQMVDARKKANKAKIRLESIKMRSMEQHAKEANYRAEARIV